GDGSALSCGPRTTGGRVATRGLGVSGSREPAARARVLAAMKRTLHISTLVLLAGVALAARPASADAGGHARVSTVSGDLLVRGPDDADWSYVDRNAVVYDGDEVWADENGLAE